MKDYNKIFENIKNEEIVKKSLVKETLEYFSSLEDFEKCIVIKNYLKYKDPEVLKRKKLEKELEFEYKELEWAEKEFEKMKNYENPNINPDKELWELQEIIYKNVKDSHLYNIEKIKRKLDGKKPKKGKFEITYENLLGINKDEVYKILKKEEKTIKDKIKKEGGVEEIKKLLDDLKEVHNLIEQFEFYNK